MKFGPVHLHSFSVCLCYAICRADPPWKDDGRLCFHRRLSVHIWLGKVRGYPILPNGIPHPGSGWGGTPSQDRGVPWVNILVQVRMMVPHPRMGVLPIQVSSQVRTGGGGTQTETAWRRAVCLLRSRRRIFLSLIH